MKHFAVFVAAIALFTAVPTMAANKTLSVDGVALSRNIVSLDQEWTGSSPLSTNLKLAVGKQSVDDTDMSLLGLAIGKRGYVHIAELPFVKLYAGGYVFGQAVSASVLETSNVQPFAENVVEPTRFTERSASLGMMSELGVRLQATKHLSIDANPIVTVPFIVNHSNSDGASETERFPAIAYNLRVGVGYSW